jgi:uncharacterized RDD family membrane protein YckC
MRPSIDNLNEKRTYYKRGTNAFGERTREPYEAVVKRKVQVVSTGARFGHYLLDLIIVVGVYLGIMFLVALIDPFAPIFYDQNLQYATSTIISLGYYFICEMYMGRTLGKFATNTVVINKYAEKPTTSEMAIRTLSRVIPFEAFSCLGERGWHDKWSETYVVKTTERDILVRLLNAQEGTFVSDEEDLLD